jgi:hypothetical protein
MCLSLRLLLRVRLRFADGTIEFLIDAFLTASNQVQGEFSGADALDYNTNYDI